MDKISSVEVRTLEILMLGMLQDDIYKLFDVLKSESLTPEDYYVVLFLLSLYNDNLLSVELILDEASFVEKLKNIPSISVDANLKGYLTFYEIFFPVLKRLSSKGINSIIQLMSNIDRKYLFDNFPMIYDIVLNRVIQSQDKNSHVFMQPNELTDLMYKIADLNSSSKVYNPFAGLASFGVSLKPGAEYFGQELNIKTWSIGAMRLMANKRPGGSRYMYEDSVLHWPDQSEKFDLIVANLPFDIRFKQEYGKTQPEFQSTEQFFIEKGLGSLNNQEGRLMVLLPQNFLFSIKDSALREKLMKMDLVEMVISLPSNIFVQTAISSALLVLNTSKDNKGKTLFINAEDCFIHNKNRVRTIDLDKVFKLIEGSQISNQRNLVDLEDVINNNYNLLANRYVYEPSELKLKEEHNTIQLKHLIVPNSKERLQKDSFGKYIRSLDLSNDIKNLQTSFENITLDEVPKLAFRLPENSLLLATRGNNLKPTFYLSSKENVFYSQDIETFNINDKKIYVEYLLQELMEDYVQAQVNRLSTRGLFSMISKKDILDLTIRYPSLDEQKQIVLKRLTLLAAKENSHVLAQQVELRKEITDENVYLRHHIAGPLGQVQKSFQALLNIIEGQVVNKLEGVMDFTSNPNSKLTFKRHLDIIKRDINSMSQSLTRTSKESELSDFKFSRTDFIKFFLDYFVELEDRKGKEYSVELLSEKWINQDLEEFKVNKVWIDADEGLLRKMFDNLVENAEVHGFNNSSFDSHKFEFEVLFSFETNEMHILVSNTGYPTPNNFTIDTYKRKGGTAGKSGGDGYGGWFVSETMKKINGKIESISETFYKEYKGKQINKITLELVFPITVDYDE